MINYEIIADSIKYYENYKFNRIEAPWTVSEYVDNITKPKHIPSFQLNHNNKCLVASGEQSFLYLYLKNHLPKGQFQTTTPCYRFEQFDFLHSKYFIKNELIKTDVVNLSELVKVVDMCYGFYKKYINDINVVETEIGFDIMYKDIEIGSYGIRTCEFLEWIYATGCAEPRLSNILNIIKK